MEKKRKPAVSGNAMGPGENTGSPTIIVIGITGSGKSKFIRLAKGCTDDKISPELPSVGHGLESETQDVKLFSCTNPNPSSESVCLVDTPGFNDSSGSDDEESLKKIIEWLKTEPQSNVHRFIYLHDISECKVRKAVKPSAIPKPPGTLVVTTKWSEKTTSKANPKVDQDRKEKLDRLKNLPKQTGFPDVSSILCLDDETPKSAWKIIDAAQVSAVPKKRIQLAAELEKIWVAKPSKSLFKKVYKWLFR
ncbi:hypothetical protein BDN70DRAFT_659390 [Pholiota conissans]|uniref:G domain-containing protein n=1 Tax=Pholiota conissans TaxID=109636 RepID=A0A9P5Z5T3_9AGAR|nr:hypothetical protein BDN70DRAFT_659390 [Pholiota conissans]